MATSTGFITIADVRDGTDSVTIDLSNENHTFAANADGSVPEGTYQMFQCDIEVFIGTEPIVYQATGTLADNRWQLNDGSDNRALAAISQTPTTADLSLQLAAISGSTTAVRLTILGDAGNNADGFLTAGDINDAIITIPVQADIGSSVVSTTSAISLSKAVGGSAEFVRMTSTASSIIYDFGAATPNSEENDDFVFTAVAPNTITTDTDNFLWHYSLDNGQTYSLFSDFDSGNGIGTQSTTTGADTGDEFTLTPTQVDTLLDSVDPDATQIIVRGTLLGANDQITIRKLVSADAAPNVVINSSASTVFRNNSGTTNLTADLYIGGDLIPVLGATGTRITAYQWSKDGTEVEDTDGGNTRMITVGASEIDDDGSSLYTCVIIYT